MDFISSQRQAFGAIRGVEASGIGEY